MQQKLFKECVRKTIYGRDEEFYQQGQGLRIGQICLIWQRKEFDVR